MKKITFLLLTVLPLIGFSQNLAINPTFTDASDWNDSNAGTGQGIVSPADSHTADGTSSYKIVSNGTFNSQIQNSNISGLVAGEYAFSYWVKGPAGVNTMPQIRDNGSNNNGTNYTIVSANTWEFVEQTFTASGAGNLSLRIFIKNNVSDTAIQVDDVSFTYIPPGGSTLTVNVIGKGTVDLALDKISYDATETETLTASAGTHFNFNGWSGDLSGSTNPASILMDVNKTVTANFVVDPTFDYNFDFNTDSDLEGWETDPQLAVSSHTGGLVTLTPTASQWARFSLFDFPVSTTAYRYLVVNVQNASTSDDTLTIIVINGSTETLSQTITTGDTGFTNYEFDLSTLPTTWTGDVSTIRVRFEDADNASPERSSGTGNIIINSISFSNTTLSAVDTKISNLSIYPNPASHIVTIKGSTKISKVQLFDVLGKNVYSSNRLINNKINVSQFKSGIYMLKLIDINNNTAVKKLVIR